MGLDMYLKKGKRIPKKSFNEILKIEEKISHNNKTALKKYKDYLFDCGEYVHWKSLFHEIIYWRKANQIHKWFVDNVQNGVDDCNYYEVSKEKIEELLSICKEVLNSCELIEGKISIGKKLINGKFEEIFEDGKIIKDSQIAEKLLPSHEGFFFGHYGYDEYYLENIEYTIQQLEKVLKETDFDNEYLVYDSSW